MRILKKIYPIDVILNVEDPETFSVENFIEACPGWWLFIGRRNYAAARWMLRLQMDGVLDRIGEYHLHIRSRSRASGHWEPSIPEPEKIAVIVNAGGPLHTPN